MLTITVGSKNFFDDDTNKFITTRGELIQLEHSLVSLSKWESKWEKPFLDSEKTDEQVVDYIRMMAVSPVNSPDIYDRIEQEQIDEINAYINAKMTATWFNEKKGPVGKKKVITSEIIYYWMVELKVPVAFEHWHLNRLITLIKVINEENVPKDKKPKVSSPDALAARRAENARRRAAMNSKG